MADLTEQIFLPVRNAGEAGEGLNGESEASG